MVGHPYFSIILPVYNVKEEFLYDCILSLYHQTFQDFEIIFVDDGSTNNAGKVCDGFIDEFPNLMIQCIHQANEGQIAARMNGFNRSCGQHILFFDSDDTIKVNTLERIKYAFEKYNCDIVMFNAERDKGGSKDIFWDHYCEKETFISGNGMKRIYQDAIECDRLNNVWLKSFKREIIEKSHIYENVSYIRLNEDYLMQLPWLDSSKSLVYLPENLYIYRMNLDSVVFANRTNFNPNAYKSAVLLYKERKKYAQLWNVENGLLHVNRRFFDEVSSCIKQIRYCDGVYTKKQQKEYLKRIANDIVFKKEYKLFDGGKCVSQIGRIALWFVNKQMWNIAIFIVRYDPKIHGTDQIK